jgi:hypothetical protein
VTVAGKRGDEFINTADRREWIHDGTAWVDRPWKDRIVANDHGWNPTRTTIPRDDIWHDQTHTLVSFKKARNDTKLRFSGYFGCFASAGVGRVYVSVWIGQTQVGGFPPPDKEIAGHGYFDDHHHMMIPINLTLSGADAPAGDHDAYIMVMVCDGNHTVEYNVDDWWALTVWEVAP